MDPDPESHRGDLTLFLHEFVGGDEARARDLMPYVYEELKAIALGCLRGSDRDRPMRPTALVNEAFLRLFDPARVQINDRKHFFRLAAKVMRQLLVDHARQRRAMKRGGAHGAVTLDEAVAGACNVEADWIDLDAALVALHELDERQARVVELRYFAGLEVEDVAEVLEVSASTVEREWRAARAWLGLRLKG